MTEQTIEQQLFNKRVDEFVTDLVALQEKHGVVALAILKSSPFGIMPDINYFDKATLEKQTGKQPAQPEVVPMKG